jgi:hypothetical protein
MGAPRPRAADGDLIVPGSDGNDRWQALQEFAFKAGPNVSARLITRRSTVQILSPKQFVQALSPAMDDGDRAAFEQLIVQVQAALDVIEKLRGPANDEEA